MEPKSVFVLVTASQCPHCKNFRRDWPEIKQALIDSQLVEIVDIEVVKLSDQPDPKKYPPDLARWVKWFPTFVLVSKSSWINAQPGQNGRLEGTIFNGVVDAKEAKYIGSESPNKESLLRWVRADCPRISGSSPTGNDTTPILSLLAAGSSSTTVSGSAGTGSAGTASSKPTIVISDSKSNREIRYVPTSKSAFCKMNRVKIRPRNP